MFLFSFGGIETLAARAAPIGAPAFDGDDAFAVQFSLLKQPS